VRRATRHLVYRAIFYAGLILMAVGLLGELLGWFDAVGQVLSLTGMAASVLALLTDESQALRDGQERMVDRQEAMLENQQAMVTELERLGDLLDERLPAE
jgi:hypothetical protein